MIMGMTMTPTINNRMNMIQHIFYIFTALPFGFFYAVPSPSLASTVPSRRGLGPLVALTR